MKPTSGWYVNFREKGTVSRCGGFFWVSNETERNDLADLLKSVDLKVEWEQAHG